MSVLAVSREGSLARVTLDRPEVRNAFNAELIGELRVTFEAFGREPAGALRAVVLGGSGAVFCAGADVEWMRGSIGLSIDENERDAAAMQAMLTAIDTCPVPVVARVQGAALGGGMGLCAVADIVIATAGATFGFPETPPRHHPGGDQHLRAAQDRRVARPRIVRVGRSVRRRSSAAHRPGARDRDRRGGAGRQGRRDRGRASARPGPPRPARRSRSSGSCARCRADEARRHTVRHIAQQRTSAEGQEGLSAFLAKRKPSWEGD